MTVKDNISDFLKRLEKQLNDCDCFIDQWNNTDWHERCVQLDKLLHGMWSTYEDAEDIADSLKGVFPPYPFDEIKEIKNWLKTSRHKINDFVDEEYLCDEEDSRNYLCSYQKFLNKVCGGDQSIKKWHSRERQLAENERELLDMLNKSYSVLLDLMISCHDAIHNMNDESIMLAYKNREARYEQLYWTEKKDKGAFYCSLDKLYPWGKPTQMQLQEYHQNTLQELGKTRIGKLFVEHEEQDFILEVAKLDLRENELYEFFNKKKTVEELNKIVLNMNDKPQDDCSFRSKDKKKGPPIQYLFINEKPTRENTDIKYREKYRFMQYMKKHDLSSRSLCCNKKDTVNDILTCFIMQWREKKLVAENPSGGAIFRFMTDDCGFSSEVTLESYSNEMRERIKNKEFNIKTYKSVLEWFKNN